MPILKYKKNKNKRIGDFKHGRRLIHGLFQSPCLRWAEIAKSIEILKTVAKKIVIIS